MTFAGAPITYSERQRRYIASVDGNAHQSAVTIIGELEAELDNMRVRAEIAERNYSRMSQPTVKKIVARDGEYDYEDLRVVDVGYSEGIVVVEEVPEPVDPYACICGADRDPAAMGHHPDCPAKRRPA